MKIQNIILYLVLFISCTHLISCATIVSGSKQNITVTSEPNGATITVEPVGYHAVTPEVLELEREGGPYRITFKLNGYKPYSVTLTTSENGWLWGNILLGGIIGLIIDSSTGAGTVLTPDEVNANLIKSGGESQTLNEN